MPTTTRRAHRTTGEGGEAKFMWYLFCEAILDSDYTPATLAAEMGASHEAVARWMAGIAVPKGGYLKQAARLLRKTSEDFYDIP